jgi:hypothetical protein
MKTKLAKAVYLTAITVAMVGWLWLLSWLSWDVIVWATGGVS